MISPAIRAHPSELFGDAEVLTRRNLVGRGATVMQLAAAVHDGSLVRIRRGYYARPDLDPAVQRAVRVGGRFSCVSELRHRGIWAPADLDEVHLQIAPNAARLRDKDDRTAPMEFEAPGCRIHWRELSRAPANHAHAGLWDALTLAMTCLPERDALAALDSALHLGMLSMRSLPDLAEGLPLHRRHLVDWADPAAESGLETLIRYLCRVMGLRVRSQPYVRRVGRGDLEIEDVILIEADGGAFHAAEVTARDRRRDAGFVRAGRTVLHFRYAQIVYEPREVAETILAALLAHRGVRNSGEIVRRARRRLDDAGIS
ncbi:DUF559 domain-containing protein [Protaetiibacter larvae]|uniref:DUF559 domain-containing protein n=1 Tax=Protaetiibacter larvae TaxID=2592654 RepID=A0A5C1Y754_9MICO|nr:DUF559 domain-containing protein [Protaetiibacter larvae]QEO09641.1 DUF559 domain-containing protein [Protaetiibacter larvae]